jgi:hypothetical protein
MWKDVVGFEHLYEVSDEGLVRNKHTKRLKSQTENEKGYLRVTLKHGQKRVRSFVHRVVGKAFIPNPENKPQINHKDCNPKNNRVSNLEWCTPEENIKHATENNRMGLGKKHRNEDHHMCTIPSATVYEILKLTGKQTLEKTAKQFGISISSVFFIQKGRVRRDLFEQFKSQKAPI